MHILGFLAFLAVSHFVLMQIFRLTTYHAYFLKGLPLLIGYGALIGFLLYTLDMHAFFLVPGDFSLFVAAFCRQERVAAYRGDACQRR